MAALKGFFRRFETNALAMDFTKTIPDLIFWYTQTKKSSML
jgi:hypothetical protein